MTAVDAVVSVLDDPPDVPPHQTFARAVAHAPDLVRGVGWTFALGLLGTAGLVSAPLILQRVLDDHLLADGPLDRGAVVALGAVGLALAVLGAIANRAAVVRMLVAAADGVAQLRVAALRRLHALPLTAVASERRGALVARVTSDLDVVTDFVGWGGIAMLVGVARISVALVVLAVLQWQLALAALVVVIGYFALLVWLQAVVGRAHDRVRTKVAASLAAVGEAVSGMVTIRAHGVEDRVRARVGDRLDDQFRAEYRAAALGAALFSSAELFAALLTATIVVVGLVFVDGLAVGVLVAGLFYAALLVDPIQAVVETLDEGQAAASGLRRATHLLDLPDDHEASERDQDLPDGPLGYVVRGLRFAYPGGGEVLRGLDVTIAAGSRVALVGATGSGKTTLAKVLARLLSPGSGQVLLGGVPLARVRTEHLRRRVGFVPQEGFLFDGSIADNVRRAQPGASDAQLLAQADELGLTPWLATLPDGLATAVGERGGQLSAGERQLVALWRVAMVGPDVLVLDEATSAVDPALEVRLRDAIEHLAEGRTVVTVAHRLSTAEVADVVLVMSDGELVERGTHAQLLAAGGHYASMHADWTAGVQS